MIASTLSRIRTWLVAALTYEPGQQAADAMSDATRWGWLPALSGVAVGGEQAWRSHSESTARAGEMPG